MKYQFLKGVRVVELGRVLSAPYASKLLLDMGAEVTKIEAGEGDPYRELPPKVGKESVWFRNFNEGKKFLHIRDLNEWRSSEEIVDCIRKADVFIENFKPGTLEKYGLDFESLKKINPRVVYLSISAFGHDGPLAGKAGFDIVVQALSGYILDYESGVLIHPHTYLSDYASGLFAAFSATAILLKKDRKAVMVDVSMFDILVNWASIFSIVAHHDKMMKELVFRMDPVAFPYGAFKTKDGKNVVIAVVGQGMLKRFFKAMEKALSEEGISYEDLMEPSRFPELKVRISRIIEHIDLKDLKSTLDEYRIPWEEVKSGIDLMYEPHVVSRGLFEEVHLESGGIRIAKLPLTIRNDEGGETK